MLPLVLYCGSLAFLLGAVFGSFLNAWACRIVSGESIAKGRSHCPKCGHTLSALDLVPFFSWLFLRGRCRYCKEPISPRYPITEALFGLYCLSLAALFFPAEPYSLLRYLPLGGCLFVAALVDFDTGLVPELPVRLAFVWAFVSALFSPLGAFEALKEALVGALGLGGGLLLFVLAADRVFGRETMGGGDIRLFFLLGAYLGLPLGGCALFAACLFGLAFALWQKAGRGVEFPFVPAIACGAWTALLFGRPFLRWYFSLF